MALNNLIPVPVHGVFLPTALIAFLSYMGFSGIRNAESLLFVSSGSLHLTLAAYLVAAVIIPKMVTGFPNHSFVWQSRIAWIAFSISLLATFLALFVYLVQK